MTTNLDARFARYSSPFLSIFRIIFGLLYMLHGTQKLFRLADPGTDADRGRLLSVPGGLG